MDCKNIIHPFQTDEGTSQRQRLSEDLLSGTSKIDGRSFADLLVFFTQLSKHVNYYNEELERSDWQPFFQKSLPFTLATIIKYDRAATEKKLTGYKKKFLRKPSPAGLQLLLNYTFNNIIRKIDGWQGLVKDSALPFETIQNKLITDKLSQPVKDFIAIANAGKFWFCTRNFNFKFLQEKAVWNIEPKDTGNVDKDFLSGNNSKRKRLVALYTRLEQLIQSFLDVFRILATGAEMSIGQSLLPLKEELKEKHPPHLAILFAFIKLFEHLQGSLNDYTKKHLDFFYNKILLLKPKAAAPDKVHVVVEIQKQLNSYLFKKGLLLKDGKDKNKEEIYFATDDEIVINKTQVADQRTLFLNNRDVKHQTISPIACVDNTVIEGVYAATDSTKANGVEKDFTEGLPARATLGDKWSKYTDPENKFTYSYPNARLGFILASPVLLLNEGKRTVTITLNCELESDYCKSVVPETGIANTCCDKDPKTPPNPRQKAALTPPFANADIFGKVATTLQGTFYYINRDLIAKAVKKGIGKDLESKLIQLLTIRHVREEKNPKIESDVIDDSICYCTREEKLFEITIQDTNAAGGGFEDIFSTSDDRNILMPFFPPRTALSVLFSGEKEWIKPNRDRPVKTELLDISMGPLSNKLFSITIKAILTPDQPAVTFYNAEALKEELNSGLPMVKLELDDKIKLEIPFNDCKNKKNNCCEKEITGTIQQVSLYHFFRDVKVLGTSKIEVKVCGVKNLIVQNDENLENANNPITAFGPRPKAGSSFYIGSKEIFFKNWQSLFVNVEWKDRPLDFEKQYEQYAYNGFLFEDGQPKIVEGSFRVKAFVLDDHAWRDDGMRRLFKFRAGETAHPNPLPKLETSSGCSINPLAYNEDVYDYVRGDFPLTAYKPRQDFLAPLLPLTTSSSYGFLKLRLEDLGFQHDNYSFVLARQMMALADLVSPLVIGPVVEKINEAQKLINAAGPVITSIDNQLAAIQPPLPSSLADLQAAATTLRGSLTALNGLFTGALAIGTFAAIHGALNTANAVTIPAFLNNAGDLHTIDTEATNIGTAVLQIYNDLHLNEIGPINVNNLATTPTGLIRLAAELKTRIDFIVSTLVVDPNLKLGLPNQPYTPVIKTLSVDYTAEAIANDIDLIHLYPYVGTYKPESLPKQPMLFPTFCDEGNFFIGLKDLVPGSNVNILFQLAEATADSESDRQDLVWSYLENNSWKLLRTGFEVLHDDTNGLTTSGIIKFMLPANMTNENTVMPAHLHWIKATIPSKSGSVSEIIGIHTQAIKAVFTNETANDRSRLGIPLPAGAVAKLKEADSNIKKVNQPYDSFGGRLPEEDGHFYVRASELLHHKNRAVQKFDYERLALEAFPQLFKVKCINHTYGLDAKKYSNDFGIAPGYVLLAVIPDLNLLKAAKSFEPKAPVSLLEEIEEYLKTITSPFVRLRIKNPRYEKVNFCLRVKLIQGKDEVYYKEKLQQDIREFLAPWAVGEFDKLSFGQPISRSDMVRFLESRDYIDYIIDLRMLHADLTDDIKDDNIAEEDEVVPITPRSILVAGSIDVCIDSADCETWCFCKSRTGKPCSESKRPTYFIKESSIASK